MTAEWFEVSIEVPQQHGEAVASFLFDHGAPGLQCDEREGKTLLTAYFAKEPPLESLRLLCADIGALSPPECAATVCTRRLADEDWAENWKLHFRPRRIGRRLYVCPPWDCTAAADGVRVVIEPGMAFGTGEHASTRGCLTLLEDVMEERAIARALDVGTGSGVLAIAMAKLGAAEVWAVDIDPTARAAAALNVQRNQVGPRVQIALRLADVAGAFDLVVANLFANLLQQLASEVISVLKPGGTVICSGLLRADEQPVLAAYAACGCHLVRRCEENTWVTLALRRPAAP